MTDVKWIKITTDIFDDEKIQLIECLPDADAIIVIWFKLLCFAGKQNNSGVFVMNDRVAYTDKMLAAIFRRKESVVQLALQTFESFGMIEIIDGVITIPNWGKHQTLDQIENRREYMQKYMQGYRKKQKELVDKSNGKVNSKVNSKPNGKVNVNSIEEEGEIEREIDIESNKSVPLLDGTQVKTAKKTMKIPPTLEEVEAYCKERHNNINAQHFIDYYESKGWTVGHSKMKDWKAAVRTWEGNQAEKATNTKSQVADLMQMEL